MKAKFRLSLFWIFFIEMAVFIKKDCAKTSLVRLAIPQNIAFELLFITTKP